MAIINRKNGMVSGTIGDEVFGSYRGRQTVRKAAGEHTCRNSTSWVDTKAAVSIFSSMWRELPGEIKAAWDMYAAAQGSASEVETNDNVSYRCCPITNYPPRPKLVRGFDMFIGLNAVAHRAGLSVPRLNPSIGVGVPTLPLFNCDYQRSTGELIVNIQGAILNDPRDIEALKANIWLSAFSTLNNKSVKILDSKMIDTFDMPRSPQNVQRRYTGYSETQRAYGYKPLVFKELPYVRVYVGAQVVLSPGAKWAPVVSSGNWTVMYLLNQTRYIELGDLLEAGLIKHIGNMTFTENTAYYLAKKREELAKKEFIKVSEV